MIVDYRIYLTIAVIGFVVHLLAFPLIHWRGGRYFYAAEAVAISLICGTGVVSLLDWVWS